MPKRKEKKRKIYGKSSRGEGVVYENSEDELGGGSLIRAANVDMTVREEVEDDQTPLDDSAAARRVNAMLNNYSGSETSIFGESGYGSHFSIETSIQKASTAPSSRAGVGALTQKSDSGTWPTVPNTTAAKSTSNRIDSSDSPGANAFNDEENEQTVAPDNEAASQSHRSMDLDDRARARHHANQDSNQDELAPPASSNSKRKRSNIPEDKSQKHTNALDELGSDDPLFTVPKDQYQPRPSRSRGSHGEADLVAPEDFSKRPEDLVKSKRKARNRRKTTALAKPSPKIEIEDEDEHVAEVKVPFAAIPTFLRATKDTKSALDEDGPLNVIQGECNLAPGAATGRQAEQFIETKAAATSSSSKKRGRGRPKKQATQAVNDSDDEDRQVSDDDMTDAQGSVKNQHVRMGRKTPSEPLKEKALSEDEHDVDSEDEEPVTTAKKRKGITLPAPSDDEHDTELPDVQDPSPEIPKSRGRKKRKPSLSADDEPKHTTNETEQPAKPPPKKRGRKKKTDTPVVSAPTILSDHEDEDSEHTSNDKATKTNDQVLSHTEANTTKAPLASPTKLTTPPTTPPKTAKPVHSPINSSTVKFRVGLSKRARIAPLLKIVRK